MAWIQPRELLRRLHGSAVGWSWAFNILRLASGLILLPLMLKKWTAEDLGMYYFFLNQAAIVPLVDFGFGPTISRFVSYAMGGAQSIQAHGVPKSSGSSDPNYPLLWQLLSTTRRLYGYLTLVLLAILLTYSTYLEELTVGQTSSPAITRIAWAITIVSAAFDVYANWWTTYLRGMNQIVASAKIGVWGILLRLAVSAGLLLSGAGLLSLPIGTLFGSTLQRWLARRDCLRRLGAQPQPAVINAGSLLKTLWPNSWRVGVQFFSGYLTVNANTTICAVFFGLRQNAAYGLSLNLLGIIAGMAGVWTTTKWPIIGQHYARQDLPAVRRTLWARVWLQNLSFLAAGAGLLVGGPFLLMCFGSGKELLPSLWLTLVVLNGFLEMQFNIWGTLLTLENRVPYLWPTVATNVLSLELTLLLLGTPHLDVGALVLGPLIAGCIFNYWFWPFYTARSIGTSLFAFLLRGPNAKA